MRFSTALIALSAGLGTVFAESSALLYVSNKCLENVYVVYSNEETGKYQQAQKTLSTGQGFQVRMDGLGYSVGFSVDPNFYSTSVPKLIMGYSVNAADSLLYYSITTNVGNPFSGQSWSLTSDNSQCTRASSPNGVTYACAAGSYLIFTLCG